MVMTLTQQWTWLSMKDGDWEVSKSKCDQELESLSEGTGNPREDTSGKRAQALLGSHHQPGGRHGVLRSWPHWMVKACAHGVQPHTPGHILIHLGLRGDGPVLSTSGDTGQTCTGFWKPNLVVQTSIT